MKKNWLFLTVMLFSLTAGAQFTVAPVIGGGITMPKLTLPEQVGFLDARYSPFATTKSIPSFYVEAGAEVKYELMDVLRLESGLKYQYVEQKMEIWLRNFSGVRRFNLHYIALPLNIVYGKKTKGIYAGAGVNFAFGMGGLYDGGKVSDKHAVQDVKFDGQALTINDGKFHLNPMNMGVNLKAGYTFGKLYAGATACIGLSDLYPSGIMSKDYDLTFSTYGVQLGYNFGLSCCKHKK